MNTPEPAPIAPEILQRLANSKTYTLLLFYKDVNYDLPESRNIVRTDHLNYQFKLRAEGKFLLAMPVTDATNPDLRAIGVFTSAVKDEVKALADQDPVVINKILKYELLNVMGLVGDSLI